MATPSTSESLPLGRGLGLQGWQLWRLRGPTAGCGNLQFTLVWERRPLLSVEKERSSLREEPLRRSNQDLPFGQLDSLPLGRLMGRNGDTCLGGPTPHPKL